VAVHSQELAHKSLALAKDTTDGQTKSASIQRKKIMAGRFVWRHRRPVPAMLSDVSSVNYDEHEVPILPHPKILMSE
jgi:hypothetical protein